ncbi:MAG: hypothetical protein HOP33_19130 [Verrucomicrobia bacterium]|nr:hypothetical protein [Verrucomicrobiota bacterium]
MKTKSKFYPGWKMTVEQHNLYFRLLDQAAVASGETTQNRREDLRQRIHLAAFGGPKSAKAINHLKDFDDFKAAVLAIIDPSNLNVQMRQAEMPTTRLVFAIRKLAPEAYIIAEARRKFFTEDWATLDESSLTMLRNHITKRAAGIRWPAQEVQSQDPDWNV